MMTIYPFPHFKWKESQLKFKKPSEVISLDFTWLTKARCPRHSALSVILIVKCHDIMRQLVFLDALASLKMFKIN